MMPYKQMEEEAEAPADMTQRTGHPILSSPVMISPGPQPGHPVQSPQVILIVPSSHINTPIKDKKAKILLALGATQLSLGILLILFNVGASIMWAHVSSYVGPGYWCGIFAVLTGTFGIAAGKKKGRCLTITFMVLSIIASIVTVGIIVCGAVGAAESPNAWEFRSYRYYYDNNGNRRTDAQHESEYRQKINASIAWNSLLLIAGILEFIISIVSSAMCCGAICGNSPPAMHPAVQYLNGAQQLSVNGQLVTATNWFPAPAQAAGAVPPGQLHHPIVFPQQPAYVATKDSPPPSYDSNKQ